MSRAMPLSRAKHKSAVGSAELTSYSVPVALARLNRADMDTTMNRIGGRLKAASAGALALALAPVPLAAQSTDTYRLPGATVRPAPPGSQGPVDRDNPVVTTAVPRPAQSATPTPAPTQASPQPSPSAAPAAGATRSPAPRPAPTAPRQGNAAVPAASPTTTVAPAPSPQTSEAVPGFGALPSDIPAPTAVTPPAVVADDSGWYWKWVAAAAVLLALIFAGLWLRRSLEPAVLQIAFERPIVPAPRPQPAAEPAVSPVAAALPEPRLSLGLPAGLGMALEARRMSASLMATTLSYAVTLTNTGTEPLSMLAVEGDMVSAHASLPPEAQIASNGQRLEPRHNLVTLAPGESAEFTGDFRLPLSAVTPIRAGGAAYFVPLARLRVEASTAKGESLVQVQTYVVGEMPDDPAAALKPFRLDLGPRTYSRVGQRAVN